jgi:hypothetical protein
MTGFQRRRSSGEIINATLLEVFLTLSFMIFALAVFHKRRADIAEARAGGPGTVTISAESLAIWRQAGGLRDSLARTRRVIDSLRFASPYPPDCEPKANPPQLVTVTLAGPEDLLVVAHRPRFGLAVGQSARLSPEGFRARFADVRKYGLENGCRFWVEVRDTPAMPKASYKAAMAAITATFRQTGAYR